MNSLAQLTDASLHSELKRLVGSTNTLTAQLLAHLAEVEARGIHRERACSSLYTYCVYELRMSEDEAQRRCRAARLARQFPILLDLVAEASLHLTGLLLIGPHLTEENHTELLARARFRTKREIERLIAEIAPCAELPSVVEPLYRAGAVGARTPASTRTRESHRRDPPPVSAPRYRVQFTADPSYVELLEEARNLLQHELPTRDLLEVQRRALELLVQKLRQRKYAAPRRPRATAPKPSEAGAATKVAAPGVFGADTAVNTSSAV